MITRFVLNKILLKLFFNDILKLNILLLTKTGSKYFDTIFNFHKKAFNSINWTNYFEIKFNKTES